MDEPEKHPTAWPCEQCLQGVVLDGAIAWMMPASTHYRIVWSEWVNEVDELTEQGGGGLEAMRRFGDIQQEARQLRTLLRALRCPLCGATARSPQDIDQGYCGQCHWRTFDPVLVNQLLNNLAEEAEAGYDLDKLRPRPKPGHRVELWAFCDDPECEQRHLRDEFGNPRHKLPDDHPLVVQLNEETATVDPGA